MQSESFCHGSPRLLIFDTKHILEVNFEILLLRIVDSIQILKLNFEPLLLPLLEPLRKQSRFALNNASYTPSGAVDGVV